MVSSKELTTNTGESTRGALTNSAVSEGVISFIGDVDFSGSFDLLSTDDSNTKSSVAALPPQAPQRNRLKSLTIDKLNIPGLGLYGRDKELDILKSCFEKLSSATVERQLILISGYSGTGKTSLANSLREPTRQRKGLFVRGKFDLSLRHEPYSGIASACAEICGHILGLQRHNPILFEQVCEQLRDELGSELALLTQVISVLGEVIDPDNGTLPTAAPSSSADAKNRFQFAFQRFIRIISTQFAPFILVLDDLQWADGSSLDLLDAFISDRGNSDILVVGLYRSNEVTETHIFHRTMDEFRSKSQEQIFEIAEMQIGNLDMVAVDQVIQDLLSMEGNARSLGLAEICFKKTNGNAFFLVHLMRVLHENGLLEYNYGTLSWHWNDEEIENNTKASANVVDMLKEKMTEQPTRAIGILKASAYLGSTFEEHNLRLVLREMASVEENGGDESSEEDLAAVLESLEQDGYIKQKAETAHKSFVWAHDKIQEAAMALVPNKEHFSHKIGQILLSQLDAGELETAIFVVANLLNSGKAGDTETERLKLANLNYEASRKAVALSAYESAAEYAGKGIELLPKSRWTDHYQLTMDLYSAAAQAHGYLGNVEQMESYCEEVLSQKDRPVEDKFSVYNTWIDSILNRGKLTEANEMLLDILKQFKCRFPKNPVLVVFRILSNVVQIKASIKSLESKEFEEMTDPTRIELMKFLDKLATCLYYEKDDRMPLAVFRSLNWTNTYGFCNHSSASYASAGVIISGVLNDIQSGSIYGQKALDLMDKCQSRIFASRTLFLVNGFIFPWTKPMREMLKPLMRCYDVGLTAGDTESGLWGAFVWCLLKYIMGTNLRQVEGDFEIYSNQMKDLRRYEHHRFANVVRQVLLNLMERNEDGRVTELVGQLLSEEDIAKYKQDKFLFAAISYWHGVLLTYFGEHVRHAKMTMEIGHDLLQKSHVCTPGIMFDTLLKGISCFIAAGQTGKRRYAKLGEIMRSKMKKWHSMGNPNIRHYDSFLDAEHAVLKGKKFDAIKHYEVAVLLAARSGYQQDAAFASERLAEFQLFVMDNKDEGAFRMTQAMEYWRGWGAMAKVESLERKYSVLMPQPTDVVAIAAAGH